MPVLLHRERLVRLVAVSMTPQVNRDAAMVRREVLLLVAEAPPVAVGAVDEDDGRVTRPDLVVDDTGAVSGGD